MGGLDREGGSRKEAPGPGSNPVGRGSKQKAVWDFLKPQI